MQSMFEAYAKSQKKAGKSKKRKKRDYDSSDSSKSEWETGYGNTELNVDKRLNIDKPLEPIYLSHKPRPIKVVNTALSIATKADGIAKETTETGKVTTVIAGMSIFKRKRCELRSASLGNERPSRQKAERANFSQEKYPRIAKPFSKIEKRLDTKEISI
jgi:hypothetical protein